jgi:hypothetical protein
MLRVVYRMLLFLLLSGALGQLPAAHRRAFLTRIELRNAVLAAQAAGSNCNALVYRRYGPMNEWNVARLTNFDLVFSRIQGGNFCPAGQLNLNNWAVSRVTSMQRKSFLVIASLMMVLPIVPNFCHCLCFQRRSFRRGRLSNHVSVIGTRVWFGRCIKW